MTAPRSADDDEQRSHIVVTARRQAVVGELQRCRRHVPFGVALLVAGIGGLIWLPIRLLDGGVVVSMMLFGVVVAIYGMVFAGRGAVGWIASARQLRDLDAHALPAARAVKT